MSDSPKTLNSDERNAVFAAWLKPVPPAAPPKITIVDRVAPWRQQFADAIAIGYTWPQLAKEIAPKPEIGVRISGDHLRKAVIQAFAAAKEAVPPTMRVRRRRKQAKKAAGNAPVVATKSRAEQRNTGS